MARLNTASMFPYLTQQLGVEQSPNPIESLLHGGVAASAGLTPLVNTSAIGADNAGIAAGAANNMSSVFALISQRMADATARAERLAAERAAAESARKQSALQAKLLKSQKNAALDAVKNITNTNVPTPLPSVPKLTPMPTLPPIKSPKDKAPQVAPPPGGIILPPAVPPVKVQYNKNNSGHPTQRTPPKDRRTGHPSQRGK